MPSKSSSRSRARSSSLERPPPIGTRPPTKNDEAYRDDGKEPVYSCYLGGNIYLFPRILRLHVPKGAVVADVTYGKGVFWRLVPEGRYEVRATDIVNGVDCRCLPYEPESIDCVVLDPPYMEGLLRQRGALPGTSTHTAFRKWYSNGKHSPNGEVGPRGDSKGKWHQAVIALYFDAGREALRVLRPGGILIVKCQDEVSANQQWLTHVEIVNEFTKLNFYAKDLFVLMRPNRPRAVAATKQVHARKRHSYFLVFQKPNGSGGPRSWDSIKRGRRKQRAKPTPGRGPKSAARRAL